MATAFPSLAQTRRKRVQPFQDPNAYGQKSLALSGGLPPLPALGSSEPTSPATSGLLPNVTQALQGGAQTSLNPLHTRLLGQIEKASVGKRASDVQQMYRDAGLPIPASATLQGQQPLAGGMGAGGNWEQLGTPEQAAQAMQMDPRALRFLDPEFATHMQMQSEQASIAEQQAKAQEAIGAVAMTPEQQAAAQPPDIQGILGEPGRGDEYWISRRRAGIGDVSARFQEAKRQLQEQARHGASPAWIEQRMQELGDAERGETLRKISGLNRERSEFDEQARLAHARTYLDLYGQAAPLQQRSQLAQAGIMQDWPTQAVPWTGVEGYLRGARNDQLAALMGMRGGAGGGGGGGGGGGVQPFEDSSGFGPFGGGVVSTPHSSQYLGAGGGGGGGGGGAVPPGYLDDWFGPEADQWSRVFG